MSFFLSVNVILEYIDMPEEEKTSWGWAEPSSVKLKVIVTVVVEVTSWSCNQSWSSTTKPGGLWSDKAKLGCRWSLDKKSPENK